MSETLQIKIAPEHPANDDDELGRTMCGSYPGITPTEAWRRGRAGWSLDPTRVFENVSEVEIIDHNDVVLAIALLRGLVRHGPKYEITGPVQADDPRIGKPSVHPHPSRNRINYY